MVATLLQSVDPLAGWALLLTSWSGLFLVLLVATAVALWRADPPDLPDALGPVTAAVWVLAAVLTAVAGTLRGQHDAFLAAVLVCILALPFSALCLAIGRGSRPAHMAARTVRALATVAWAVACLGSVL